MTFERTFDWELIRAIMTNPRVWVKDDFSGDPERFSPNRDERIWYVLVRDDEGLIAGLYILAPQNDVTWEIHTRMLPRAWGKFASRAARAMSEWIWQNTPCRRIVTSIPETNLSAILYAKAAGMTIYGINADSFQHGGKLQSQVLMGLSCHS